MRLLRCTMSEPKNRKSYSRSSTIDFLAVQLEDLRMERAQTQRDVRSSESAKLEELFSKLLGPGLQSVAKDALRRFMMCSVLLEVGRFEQAKESQRIYTELLKTHANVSANALSELGKELIAENRFVIAVLVCQLAIEFASQEGDQNEVAHVIMNCLQNLEELTKLMTRSSKQYHEMIKVHVMPFMREALYKIENLTGAESDIRFTSFVCSCFFVGFSEWSVRDLERAEQAWQRAIGACRQFYGADAGRQPILATCYHNMGSFCAQVGREREAQGYLELVEEVHRKAEEWSTTQRWEENEKERREKEEWEKERGQHDMQVGACGEALDNLRI